MNKKKILVADDDKGIVEAMQILLEDEGFDVITTSDATAVEGLFSQNPDLVFLDIWMSGFNGNTICKQLKASDSTRNVPIIIFSANQDTRQIAADCGADDFLAKPFEITDLLQIVRKYTN